MCVHINTYTHKYVYIHLVKYYLFLRNLFFKKQHESQIEPALKFAHYNKKTQLLITSLTLKCATAYITPVNYANSNS